MAAEGDNAFRAHAGFGQPEMQRIVGAARQFAIDRDQVLHRRHLGRQDDAVLRQADLLGARGRQQRRLHHGLVHDRARAARLVRLGVLVHQLGQQLLVERAPIGADAHRLAVFDRQLDDGRELLVLLVLEADIAGIDAVFVERLGAARMIGQKLVADVVEVADERHRDAHLAEAILDVRHGGRRLVAVDRDAHQFGAGARQRRHLARGRLDVGRVGIGHRLHDDRRRAADRDAADVDRDRFVTLVAVFILVTRTRPHSAPTRRPKFRYTTCVIVASSGG